MMPIYSYDYCFIYPSIYLILITLGLRSHVQERNVFSIVSPCDEATVSPLPLSLPASFSPLYHRGKDDVNCCVCYLEVYFQVGSGSQKWSFSVPQARC